MESLKALHRRALLATDYHVGERIRLNAVWRAMQPLLGTGVKSVLDAGSGNGKTTLLMARSYSGVQVRGVDMNLPVLTSAGEEARQEGLTNVEFVYADLTTSLGEGLYDLVYNVDVMEHIADDRKALANFAQALRPGGWVIIHTPLTPQKHFLQRYDLSACPNDLHVREGYRRGELEGKLRDAGLVVKQVVYTHANSGTLAWELWKLSRWHLLPKLLLRPVIEALLMFEQAGTHRDGNCILVVAQKPGA